MIKSVNKTIVKNDNRKVPFDTKKIQSALLNASLEQKQKLPFPIIDRLMEQIVGSIIKEKANEIPSHKVHNIVVLTAKNNGYDNVAKALDTFKAKRQLARDKNHRLMSSIKKIGVQTDRDNANVGNNFSAKLLRIASEANKWHILNDLLPGNMAYAHEHGDYYIHDLDSYNLTINCLHLPTKRMLLEGFNTGYGLTKPAKRIETAAALSCILLQSSQNDMFGGQSHPNFDNDMAPFVAMSRKEIEKECKEIGVPKNKLQSVVDTLLFKKVKQAMQSVIYNLNTMHSRAGAQVPFSSVNIGIPDTKEAAIVCQAFLEEYLKGMGLGEQAIFPNVVFRVKQGVNRDPKDKYHYLYKMACHVAGQRMNPTFMNMDADFNKVWFDKHNYPATMGCRTYVMANINGKDGTAGRGNIAPVTINIVRIAHIAKKDVDLFFKLFDEKIYECRDQLLHRYSILKNLKVSDLPFVAGQHILQGSEKLKDSDSIEPILKQGTYGIGFIGLAEVLKLLIGKHHGESDEAQQLGLKIVGHLRKRCDELKQKHKLNFSCYATPAEGLSGKFTQLDNKYIGGIPGISEKDYYTNSYHVPVDFAISPIRKLELEAPYHKLCNAGHISYVEFDNYPTGDNIEKIISHVFKNTNIGYVGCNFHIRYCRDCATRIHNNIKKCSCSSCSN